MYICIYIHIHIGKLFQSSQEAFRNNHKKEAKELSDNAKTEGHLMDQCNKQAAEKYFMHNNDLGSN
jgi:hypothetical protein